MEARDFRGLGREAQEALRRRALFLVEQEGMTQGQAALAARAPRQAGNIWLGRYRERGEDGVLDGRRVSPRRGKGLLTAEEADKVRGWIAAGTPDALGLPFALWTGRAVRELVKDAGRKVFLNVDNLKVHHAKKVKAWVASHAHEIALFYLPAYAPEHNPDEYLNHALKQALRQKPQPDSKDELIRNARSVLRAIQRSPARVRAYFAAEPVRYAA